MTKMVRNVYILNGVPVVNYRIFLMTTVFQKVTALRWKNISITKIVFLADSVHLHIMVLKYRNHGVMYLISKV